MLSPLVALAVLPVLNLVSANAIPEANSRPLEKRDVFIEWDWSINSPTPTTTDEKTYEGHNDGGSEWYSITPSDGGIVFEDGESDVMGYRLYKDADSSVIYHVSPDYVDSFTATYEGGDDDIGNPSTDLAAAIDTTFSAQSGPAGGTDPWNSTDLVTVPMSRTWSVLNSECNGSMNLTMVTVDANGDVQTYTGIDSISGPVPTALPVNLTLTNGNDTGVGHYYFNTIEPVSAAYGSAKLAIPNVHVDLGFQFCPD